MDKIEIIPGQTDRAIAIMGETARFYRERGFRIWPEEWLTREQLVTAEARPGDLVFYSSGGHVNHVAIYIGGGQVIHASNPKTGIKISAYNYRTPAKMVRILQD